MRRVAVLALCVLGLVVAEATASARYVRYGYGYGYRARVRAQLSPVGLYGGLSLLGTRVLDQTGGPEELETGGGFSLWGGLHVSERLSLELSLVQSFHNPALVDTVFGEDIDHLVLSGLTFDAKIHFPSESTVIPFVQGGVGVYALSSEYFGTDSVGTGFQLGGGFDFWASDFVTLGLRLLYRGLAMGPPEGGRNDTFLHTATLEGNLGLHF